MDIELMIIILEYIGTIAFAISGALIAIEHKMDILGVIILGSVTAVGGGFFRDIILQREIPSIFLNPSYVIVAVFTTIVVFLFMYFLNGKKFFESQIYKFVFNVVDSLGLGVFVVVGINSVMKMRISDPFMVIFCGVLTGVGGGMIRDIMAAKIPVIFVKHIYAVAAIIGAVLFYYIGMTFGFYQWVAIVTIIVVVVIRFLAFKFRWNLPSINLSKEGV